MALIDFLGLTQNIVVDPKGYMSLCMGLISETIQFYYEK